VHWLMALSLSLVRACVDSSRFVMMPVLAGTYAWFFSASSPPLESIMKKAAVKVHGFPSREASTVVECMQCKRTPLLREFEQSD